MVFIGSVRGFGHPRVLGLWILAASGVLGLPGAAEVPTEQAYDLYLHTHPEHLRLSPLWGMAALRSGVLANFRFFGRYTSVPDPRFPPFPRASPYDCPQDALSGVVQRLFPSPDGINLVHNERDLDPIGEIAREEKAGRGLGLRKILALLDATAHYRELLRAAGGPRPPHDPAGLDYREAVYRILDWDGAAKEAHRGRQLRAYDELRRAFAHLAQRAVLEESGDTAGHYPPDILEMALLAYAWRTADSADGLYRALGDSEHGLGLLRQPAPGSPRIVFNEAYYHAQLPEFLARASGAGGGVPPGEAVAFLLGSRTFETPVPDLLPYATALCGPRPYPDCGETSLRNFLLIVLRRGEVLAPANLAAVRANLRRDPRDGVREAKEVQDGLDRFLQNHGELARQGTTAARNAWSDLLVGLNGKDDPIPVTYVEPGGFNLKGTGVTNMLNLIGHLFPDGGLTARWPEGHRDRCEEIGRRLDRLCELFSRPGFFLDWTVGSGRVLRSEFPTITFSINDSPQFQWSFPQRHFTLEALPRPRGSWPDKVAPGTANFYGDALRFRLGAHQPAGTPGPPPPHTLFALDLRSPAVAKEAVIRLLQSKDPAQVPTAMALFHRSIPMDYYVLSDIARAVYPKALIGDRRGFQVPPLMERPQDVKDRLLLEAMERFNPELSCFMIDQGADVNLRDPASGYRMVQLAAGAARNPLPMWDFDFKVLTKLIARGVDLEAKDGPQGRTALGHAVQGRVEGVGILLRAGADPLARDGSGKTPREGLSPASPTYPLVQKLLRGAEEAALARAGAHPEAK
ncbi:ankyrin repeat domain-containing protein [Mesoterricola silvestris]|uniref:Ankyrin repeat domain-containing protein n=1 Tax=Mesoterricola silvestris TaxID=2927979 RepID=A0AA48KB88_9BACT|nr:hypothetical protein [Mesoterricola silvestris]BDU72278.1 hypothetical protein METEAL_14520 [Mesoterricola silvestris]